MSFRGREIEIKLAVQGSTLLEAEYILRTHFQPRIIRSLFGSSADTYWHLSPGVEGTFLRMRERDGSTEITVKCKDRGTNLNRKETDVTSSSDIDTVRTMLTGALGEPAGIVRKIYYVYWLSKHTTVCTYSVNEDLYVEVETTTADRVEELEEEVLHLFRTHGIVVGRAAGSLYEMYIQKRGE